MARDIHRVSGAEGSRFCYCTSCIPLFKQMTQKLPETYGLENCEVVLSENSVSSRPNCWSSFSQHTHCHCLGSTPFLDKAKYHIVGLSPTIFPSNITISPTHLLEFNPIGPTNPYLVSLPLLSIALGGVWIPDCTGRAPLAISWFITPSNSSYISSINPTSSS